MATNNHSQTNTKEWYSMDVPEVLRILSASELGLSGDEVAKRRLENGLNALPEEKMRPAFLIFVDQFRSPLVYILLIAGLVVLFMGDSVDALVILFALGINAVVGTFQEGKAQAKLSALKKFTESEARVIREGQEVVLSDKELVPGDIVVLREGEKIPADLRLIEINALNVDEAAITGESEAVFKSTASIQKTGLITGDQMNMAFKGTLVASGYGRGVVVATGLQTVVGKIAAKLSTIDAEMPLKKNIESLSRVILVIVALISVFVFVLGIQSNIPLQTMFSTVVAIAVSAIPEGLPVVVTLVLATGVWRMSTRNVLVKRLQAVEALGQAKIIAVDKTGTITMNQMMVRRVYTNNTMFDIEGEGYAPKGQLLLNGAPTEALSHPEIILIARTALFTASAEVAYNEEVKEWQKVYGDPTEVALMVFAQKVGFNKDTSTKENPLVLDVPFDSKRKYHASLHTVERKNVLSVTGAPEVLLPHCHTLAAGGKIVKLESREREHIHKAIEKLTHEGLRVLLIAVNTDNIKSVEPDAVPTLTFVGLVGIADTIRSEVYDAVKRCHEAGMKVVMITGDHADTAEALARTVGIFKSGDGVITGEKVAAMSAAELAPHIGTVTVFARVSPEHKLKIIEAYKVRGDTIAMTGDGVNDALSLAAADLGVAMGKMGTEVAKEAADLVLLDDNFGSIVAAVEEGRNIYKTIQKVLLYLLSTNVTEIVVIIIAIIMGYEIPFTPGQLIWLNLVTDSFLVVALAFEFKEPGLLAGRWKTGKSFLIDLVGIERILLMGGVMILGTIIFYDQYLSFAPEKAGTVALTLLAVFQCFNAFNCRSEQSSVVAPELKTNRYLNIAVVIAIVLQLIALHVPFFQRVLHTVPLAVHDWMAITAAGLLIIMADEFRKIVYRARVRQIS